MHNVNICTRPDKTNKEVIDKLIKVINDILIDEVNTNKNLGNIKQDGIVEILADSPNGVLVKISIDDIDSDKVQIIEVHKGVIQPCFTDSYKDALKIVNTPRVVSLLSLFSYHTSGDHLNNKLLYGDIETLKKNDLWSMYFDG